MLLGIKRYSFVWNSDVWRLTKQRQLNAIIQLDNGQSELFYFTGIKKLQVRYKLCIDKGDDYIDK